MASNCTVPSNAQLTGSSEHGTLQPRALGFLNHVVTSVDSSNYYNYIKIDIPTV